MADMRLRTALARVDVSEAIENAIGEHVHEVETHDLLPALPAVPFEQAVAAEVEQRVAAQRQADDERRKAGEARREVEDEALRQAINAVVTGMRQNGRDPPFTRHDAAIVRDMWDRACKVRGND